MNHGIISIRYAKALLAFGEDTGAEERLYRETDMLAQTFAGNQELKEVLQNPVLPASKKISLLDTAAGGNISPQLTRFIRLLIKNKRLALLHFICLMYGDLYRKERHIQQACLITATPLAAETEAQLRSRLEKFTTDTLEFSTKVKPGLIGGFSFYYDTYRLDASIASRLRLIREKLM